MTNGSKFQAEMKKLFQFIIIDIKYPYFYIFHIFSGNFYFILLIFGYVILEMLTVSKIYSLIRVPWGITNFTPTYFYALDNVKIMYNIIMKIY